MGFSFNIYEEDQNWTLSDEKVAEKILELFESNLFGKITKMDLNEEMEMIPYNRQEIIREFVTNKTAGIGVETENPLVSWGAISQNLKGNGFFLEISTEDIEKINLKEIKDYLKRGRKIFPKFSWAGTSADDRDNKFWIYEADTEPLADCFGMRLGWYHVISKEGYAPYFKREDLLNTPALEVEELEDGTICLLSYAHPLDYDKPETTKKIIEITNYLNQKWFEHDPSPTW